MQDEAKKLPASRSFNTSWMLKCESRVVLLKSDGSLLKRTDLAERRLAFMGVASFVL